VFKERDSLAALDARKLIEELIEGVTPLDVFNEVLDGYASPYEDRSASHSLGIAMYHALYGKLTGVWRTHKAPSSETPII
jgi:hypothetical protein